MNTPTSEAPKQDADAAEYVDPSPPQTGRLSRKNVIALALTVVGLLLVLFLSSRGGRSRDDPVSVRPEPGHLGRAPIEIGVPEDETQPTPPSPWANGLPHTQGEPAASESPDPRQQPYEQALRSRPVLGTDRTAVNGAEDPRQGTRDASGHSGAATRLVELSDFTVAQGVVVEAALVTAIDSDRPGPVIAHVTRPVYDSKDLHHLLIPAGTRLIGTLEQALEGQDRRVVLAWTRMIFPDGRNLELPGLPAVETSGEGGLKDQVNLHMASLFGRAALIALLGGATTYASAQTGGPRSLGPGTYAGASLGLELSRVATAMLQQGLRRRPTVTIRAGYRFLVYVAHDLSFEAPYEEIPSPPRFAVPTF